MAVKTIIFIIYILTLDYHKNYPLKTPVFGQLLNQSIIFFKW